MIAVAPNPTTTSVAVRPATPQDRTAILEMYAGFEPKAAALGLPPVDAERCAAWLDSLVAGANFVATDFEPATQRARAVGHAAIYPEPGESSGEVAVFVHQDCRGRGVGKLLLTALVEHARATGLTRVWGICEQDNVPMLRLARSCGFTESWSGEFFIDLIPPSAKTSISPQ